MVRCPMADEAVLQETYQARDAFVQSLGKVDPYVLAQLTQILALLGGPMWPTSDKHGESFVAATI